MSWLTLCNTSHCVTVSVSQHTVIIIYDKCCLIARWFVGKPTSLNRRVFCPTSNNIIIYKPVRLTSSHHPTTWDWSWLVPAWSTPSVASRAVGLGCCPLEGTPAELPTVEGASDTWFHMYLIGCTCSWRYCAWQLLHTMGIWIMFISIAY